MFHIRQPFFSIVSAFIYTLMGLLFAGSAVDGVTSHLGGFELGPVAAWVFTGLMFVMAYFSLVHLRHER